MTQEKLSVASEPTQTVAKVSATKVLGYKLFTITFIDVPGYSREEDVEEWTSRLARDIEERHEEYHARKKDAEYVDGRVHLCLFFMREFSQCEAAVVNLVQSVTNVVPVLAKFDLLTSGAISTLKKRIERVSKIEGINWLDCYQISQVTFCLP